MSRRLLILKVSASVKYTDGGAEFKGRFEALCESLEIIIETNAPYKHVEARFRSNKLAARAKKLHLVGYNTKNKAYWLWDSGRTSLTR